MSDPHTEERVGYDVYRGSLGPAPAYFAGNRLLSENSPAAQSRPDPRTLQRPATSFEPPCVDRLGVFGEGPLRCQLRFFGDQVRFADS